MAAAVRCPNQAASAAARVEAHAAVDAVQAGVDKPRADGIVGRGGGGEQNPIIHYYYFP